MGKPIVFIPSRIPNAERVIRYLSEYADVDYRDVEEMLGDEQFYQGLERADGLMAYSRNKIREAQLERAPKLRAVCNIAVGYDNLDLDALTARGVAATNTPDVLSETTADLAFALLLSAARRIPEADHYVKSGQWHGWLPSLMLGKDVFGATLGIVGLGRIGQAIARRAAGFQMKVLYNNRTRISHEEQQGLEYASLDTLLQRSDYVLLQAPLTPETSGMIGARELGLMKKDAILINTARGGVVDERALIEALQEKRIAGAGLDVFEQEPLPQGHPFLSMPQVVAVPHIGSATVQTRSAMAMKAATNMAAVLRGEQPENLLNPEVWRR
ncbi:2-hydroxyacid dehydrogenase [Paenibacillus ferrarius]|uniref:2-hydroxyacid dehydrogenase n=1 Tax=Paenibacillus ferrarius TaxID=1469647 RepID=UPI003D27D9FD